MSLLPCSAKFRPQKRGSARPSENTPYIVILKEVLKNTVVMGGIIRYSRLHQEMNYFKMRNRHVNWQSHLIQHAVIYLSPEAHMVFSRQRKK